MQDLTNLKVRPYKKKSKHEVKPEIEVAGCSDCRGFEEIAKILSKTIAVVYEENVLLAQRENELLTIIKNINSDGYLP